MRLRDLLGYGMFCVGGTFLAFASGRYAVGEWQRDAARQAWEEAKARVVVALARRASLVETHRALAIAPGTPVARLRIPRIGLDEIVVEGVDVNSLNAGPGHLPGSAYPGEAGNAVISAHRDRHFARLGSAEVGDTVITESGVHSGAWIIVSKRVVDADAPALFRSDSAVLTLTTCWPIRYVGTAPERLILTARPVGRDASPSFAEAATE